MDRQFSTCQLTATLAMNVELRAVALGVDRTDWLRALGLPLSPYAMSAAEVIARLPHAEREDLARIGVLRGDTYSDRPDGTMTTHYSPSWTLRSTFHWQQVFPAGKELVVEHRYRPSVGASAGTMIGMSDAGKEVLAEYGKKYNGSERNLTSFCGKDVRKTSPTTFEMRATDYWPERNLEILLLTPIE